MKRWRQFEPYLASGLWHVHTARTDGVHSVAELVSFAVDRGFPLLGIVEHVRRELSYDFAELHREGHRLVRDHDIACAVGCEAKVLDTDGTLDVAASTVERADIVYAAYHGVTFSREEYVESVRAVLANPDVDVWAHPFSYPRRAGFDLDPTERDAILDAVGDHDVLFELNLRRPTTTATMRTALGGIPTIVGYDLHEIDRWVVGD